MNHAVADANSFFRCKSRIPWFERSGRLDYTEALAKGSTQRFVQSLVGVLNGLRADWTELPCLPLYSLIDVGASATLNR